MTLDEIVAAVTHWIDAVPADAAPQRAAELLARYRVESDGGRSPAASTARHLGRVALHESAHALVAIAGGLPFTRARINLDGSGECAYERDGGSVDRLMASVATDVAGIVAVLFADPPDAAGRWALANSYDILMARQQIDRFRAAAPAWNTPTRTFCIVALAAVHAHWPEIERTAHVLRERREVDAAEIAALCGGELQ